MNALSHQSKLSRRRSWLVGAHSVLSGHLQRGQGLRGDEQPKGEEAKQTGWPVPGKVRSGQQVLASSGQGHRPGPCQKLTV